MTLFKKTVRRGEKKHNSPGSTLWHKIICNSKVKFQKKHLAQVFKSTS